MVNTLKFSQFTDVDLNSETNEMVGFDGAANIKAEKVTRWTTAGRPSAPFDGLMGYNTDLAQWEYYDATAADWLQFLTSSTGMNWTEVTAVSVNAVENNGYITNRPATPVTVALPATCDLGDTVAIMGKGAGGWSLVANAGQTIVFGMQSTVAAGSISSTQQYDNIEVACIEVDTTWEVRFGIGNLTIV